MSLAVFGVGSGYHHHHHHHHHHPSRSPRIGMPRAATHHPDSGALVAEEENVSRANTINQNIHRGRGSVQQQTPLVEQEVGSHE